MRRGWHRGGVFGVENAVALEKGKELARPCGGGSVEDRMVGPYLLGHIRALSLILRITLSSSCGYPRLWVRKPAGNH